MEVNNKNILETKRLAIRVENPFALKVGQVFTGFGIGCGVGIGVGRPLNLGAIPMLQQVTSATRGATDAFSGIGRHANTSLRRLGAKNIEVGIGCGVGFGHGFGVGLAVKPGVVNHLQSCFGQALVKLMLKFGSVPGISVAQGMVPESLRSTMSMVTETKMQNPIKNSMELALNSQEHTSKDQSTNGSSFVGSTYKQFTSKETPLDSPLGSRTEKVGRISQENSVLQMVLKHQQVIETLIEENEKLHQILIEELKVPPSKLQASNITGVRSHNPCSDCFECRRRQRKLRR